MCLWLYRKWVFLNLIYLRDVCLYLEEVLLGDLYWALVLKCNHTWFDSNEVFNSSHSLKCTPNTDMLYLKGVPKTRLPNALTNGINKEHFYYTLHFSLKTCNLYLHVYLPVQKHFFTILVILFLVCFQFINTTTTTF